MQYESISILDKWQVDRQRRGSDLYRGRVRFPWKRSTGWHILGKKSKRFAMNIHPVEDIAIQAGLITVHCDRIVAAALKIEIDL